MPDLRLIGRLDHNFGWCDGRFADGTPCDPTAPVPSTLLGTVAGVGAGPEGEGRHRLLRDPLGLNKLFWAAADDDILVAARPRRLVDASCPFESIRALPPGTVVDLDMQRGRARVTRLALGDTPAASVARGGGGGGAAELVGGLAGEIRARLNRFFAALARAYHGTHVFVCLSGGLDSAGIAVLARAHFPKVVAVSFDLWRSNGHLSEDRRTAERLAQDLDLPLLRVTVAPGELLKALDTVLVEAIDWRDFNVHTALINACLARGVAAVCADHALGGALVLTGDLPNEFLVDYAAETYGGRTYYRLPRLPRDGQRGMLVRGLETSHREIGPFEASGLPVALPYAAAADLFLALPPEFLEVPDRKDRLSRLVFGTEIPPYVYARGKTRAQVGDADPGTGVLAICADRGLDNQWLRRRFAELHGVREIGALDRFIRGGRYRSGIPLLEEESV